MKLTNLEFLKKHNYSTKGMSEEDAKAFIIEQSKMNMAYKYIIKRAALRDIDDEKRTKWKRKGYRVHKST